MPPPTKPYRVGILGATGIVGQNLIVRLQGHPWFRLQALAASERSAGHAYREITRWALPGLPPSSVSEMQVRACDPSALTDCDLVLASLGSDIAGRVERAFVEAGAAVVSNSSAHRMHEDVPLVVPEINGDRLEPVERKVRAGQGYLVTNPNCSVTGLVLALAPLHAAFGVRRVVVTTLQALSGAGVDGPSALEMVDNVLPFIPGEEDKLEREVAKILAADVVVSAHCHRVGTLDGHLEAVSVELERRADPARVTRTLRSFQGVAAELDLPSAPPRPVEVLELPDRPQPRLDRDTGGGMTAVVGRIRPCPVLSVRFEVLSHNAVRGAAGATLLNAELLAARGLIRRREDDR
jgi:aspartate-semialdehyde dehydrogenase